GGRLACTIQESCRLARSRAATRIRAAGPAGGEAAFRRARRSPVEPGAHHPLARLAAARFVDAERDAHVALARLAEARAWAHEDAGGLEQFRGEVERAREPARDRQPEVERRARQLDRVAERRDRLEERLAAPAVALR